MVCKFRFNYRIILTVLLCLVLSTACLAVSSKVVRHTSSSDLLKGQTEGVVIGSRGTIQLGRASEILLEEAEDIGDVWSINSIVVSGGTIYFGTSPNGGIYKYSLNKLTKIYPQQETWNLPEEKPDDANEPDGEEVEAEEHLTNEHIFAMATDVSGRLLAGISGKNCRLCRFEGDKMEIIFEPDDAKYIFAITVDGGGNIYLGTGPEGKVYRLNSLGRRAKLVYDSLDKNILSLVSGADGFIYAGSDSRGLVYKINPRTEKATVLYDSEQPEVTALLFMDEPGSLYAAATSAKIVQTQTHFAAKQPSAGRPEEDAEGEDEGEEEDTRQSEGGRELKIANTKRPAGPQPGQRPPQVRKVAKPGQASYIYKVNKDGFVTTVFGESVVFFCLSQEDGKLLAGTGNSAQLFSIDPAAEQEAVIYEDEQASQITAIAIAGEDVYLGMANPAKLVKLGLGFTSQGTYVSDLIDAGQPAKWGKLQLEADVPKRCKIKVASRSGNVKDVNDPTFSQWTEPVEILEPIQLECPLGRFCQYKLILESEDGNVSPLVREIAVASTVPNLAPKVESVTVERIAKAGKEGVFNISYRTTDDNDDKLTYKIDFRKLGRTSWIELEDETDKPSFEWDGKTVEDGRYEVRVTADDAKSNTASTALSSTRISEPVIVDNTGPIVKNITTSTRGRRYKIFEIKVRDALSAIEKLEYTIDSNADWTGTVPDDLVYDTTEEDFTIRIETKEDLPAGDHVLTVKVSDAVGNTTYKTFDVNIK
ncbi:MAG: hypothetical protein PVH77_01025 [Phycisphaerales bacterium]|jgi:hypothetical protein